MAWMESSTIYRIPVPSGRREHLVAALLDTGKGNFQVELFGLPGHIVPSGPTGDTLQSGRVVTNGQMLDERRAVEFDYRFAVDGLEIRNLRVWGYRDCDSVARALESVIRETLWDPVTHSVGQEATDTDLLFRALLALGGHGFDSAPEEDQNRRDLVYVVDYPDGYYRSCGAIIRTCEEFHMFGAANVPTYRGATTVHAEPDGPKRRAEMVAFVRDLLCTLPSQKQVEVYTIDEELVLLINTSVAGRKSATFVGVFRIENRERVLEQQERETRWHMKRAVACPACGVSVRESRLERHVREKCHGRRAH